MDTKQKLELAVQALRDVVNPVRKWEREMPKDHQLSGQNAAMLLRERSTYTRIAEEALKKLGRKV